MKQTVLLSLIIIVGFAAQFGLRRHLETHKTPLPTDIAEADLYFKPATIKKLSFGFDGLIADYYWMSALQYIGNKLYNSSNTQIDNLKPLNPHLLYPMLDAATTLDPDFMPPYTYGSMLLPAINVEEAIKISEKGIAAQRNNWRMYHQLGFIYWKNGDYDKASQIYALGATKPDAPDWMNQMTANMHAQGGSRDTARAMYHQIYENAPNQQTRDLATLRLLQIDSFDERDAIRTGLQEFKIKNNRCPNTWREVFAFLQKAKLPNSKTLRFDSSGTPVDPSESPYLLVNKNDACDVDLNWKISKIPYQ